MKCPACDNNLTEINATGIKINVCKGSCGGLWVKNTQIKKIDRLKSGTGSKLLLIEKAAGIKIYRDVEHPCPQCKTTLLYRKFAIFEKLLLYNNIDVLRLYRYLA